MNLFQHAGYKTYLNEITEERGAKAALAEALRCQRGYVTAVLKGESHFSLEQAEILAEHLTLSEDEHDYFLLLVQKDRAGTPSLKRYFETKIDEIRNRRNLLRHRYKDTQTLSLEQKVMFYSSWHYSAVHICLFAGLRERDAIARALGLPMAKVNEAFDFLRSAGLLRESDDGLAEGLSPKSFLPGDSPLISKHHLNWRLRAMQSIDANVPTDLHYSAVISISKEDVEKVRAMILETIDRFKKTVAATVNETKVYSLTIDLFDLFQEQKN